jgi:hypothetical protein
MIKFLIVLFAALTFAGNCPGQSTDDYSNYQDTVFIRYNKDWSADTIHYVIDTVIFMSGMQRHVLTGTTVLPWTGNQQGAKEYGLFFTKVTKSDCIHESEFGEEFENKINSIVVTDSNMIIDFNINDNCCYDFLCDISVDASGILHLLYSGYGTYCFCDCCFGLTYHLNVIKSEDEPKITAVMIGDDHKTIRKVKEK